RFKQKFHPENALYGV
ncbi:hypothetical protein PENANT_c004G07424, partial [Penicillium antarcticum]